MAATRKKSQKLTSKYEVKIEGIKTPIVITYYKGMLKNVEGLEGVAMLKAGRKVQNLPFTWQESDLEDCILMLDKRIEIVPQGKVTNEKITLWYNTYKEHFDVKYKIVGVELRTIKQVPIKKSELDAYFKLPDKYPFTPKTITNYVRNYNALQRQMKEGTAKTSYPNEWSKRIEAKIPPDELQAYWQHLTKNGFRRLQVGVGTVWRKQRK